ncbi:methylmalonyl-CoA mutase subunit beta [Salegentibacter sp. BDJ18]|uniref:methylmalonyl-CoA mutase subunit beta n=1 Tax=Salegentibacter sp. BDJ18 TaxID=2816376 RepID=UPI001AAE597A|nr:methylmalonyl-CoA mutase subunit beta [Salegentibacter sp. BDJ18]MBO2544880.1 methylmalonyl-CoA mutase subunit beta [Salegentibacter sp. BDJ18]
MKESLFQEFEEVSAKEWKQKIQFDLKGADYNEKLVYKSLDGINIKPFYSGEDVEESIKTPSPKNWNICERLYVVSVEKSNKRANEILNKGTESLWFIIPNEEISIENLLEGIVLDKTIIYFSFSFFSENYFKRFREYFKGKQHQVFLQFDIVGNLARSGNWFHNLQKDHEILNSIFTNSKDFKSVISIDTALYQNAGANIPQQLAYALAHVNEYLNHFQESPNFEKLQPQFLIASGPNYFFEIAKIKALRWLYATLASEYNIPETCHILAQPTKRNKTLYDFNVNLLRTTTESMSAVLGGADTVYNMPYDAIYHKNNEFGDRIAHNQLLVMKHEAYLDKVANAAEGAYYIESLTKQFAEMALDIFKEIEKGGGFLKQLKEGAIQRKIKESAKKEQEQFDSGELVLIGTNKFENPQDKMKDELELYPFLKQNPRKTLIEPILERRISEQIEQERIKQEKVE